MKDTKNPSAFCMQQKQKCGSYLSEVNTNFIYREFKAGFRQVQKNEIKHNYLIIILEGQIRTVCNGCQERKVGAGEMFVISKSTFSHGECLEDTKMLIHVFDIPKSHCNKLSFQNLSELAEDIDYDVNTLPIKKPIALFTEMMTLILRNNIQCGYLHEIKHHEIFFYLKWAYSPKELASLFYPVLSKSFEFRIFVLENYMKVRSVNELVQLSNMCKTVFYSKFNEEFGMPAKQWLMQKQIEKIRYKASEPGITVKKLMVECSFSTLSQFQMYCKKHLGHTPTELINKYGKT